MSELQRRNLKVKKYWKLFFVIIAVISVCSCASLSPNSSIPPPDWQYEQNAVHVNIKVDPQLNLSEGLPHTLVLCVYQLKDPNKFNQLAGDEEGLYQLLECRAFDASVTSYKRLIVYPGQDIEFTWDRSEGAKYIAFAAGYYSLHRDRMVRLFKIPARVKRRGFLWLKKYLAPEVINIELTLGQLQIQQQKRIEGK